MGRAFSDVITELALGGYAGFHTTGPPTGASAFGVYWPTLIPATACPRPPVPTPRPRASVNTCVPGSSRFPQA